MHEVLEVCGQDAHLLGQRVDHLAASDLSLFAHPAERALVEHTQQLVEAPAKILAGRSGRLAKGRGETPDLPALLLVHVAEGLDETRDEITLGEQHVDGKAEAQAALHLVDALADPTREIEHLVFAGAADIADAHRGDDPVQGLLRAEPFDQVQEPEPLLMVLVLARPAPRGVEDHALAGHPPIAIPRPAEPAHPAAGGREVRELQPRIAQRGRLSAPWWTDDRVPGKRVERLLAALLRALQRGDRLLELRLHLRDLVLEVGARRGRVGGGLGLERLLELARRPALLELVDPDDEKDDENRDQGDQQRDRERELDDDRKDPREDHDDREHDVLRHRCASRNVSPNSAVPINRPSSLPSQGV